MQQNQCSLRFHDKIESGALIRDNGVWRIYLVGARHRVATDPAHGAFFGAYDKLLNRMIAGVQDDMIDFHDRRCAESNC
jgi:hypothetical protein